MMNVNTYLHISQEVARARKKFPDTGHNFVALVEEVGELAAALLQQDHEKHKGIVDVDIYSEAVQCVAMAIRVMEEGDSNYPAYNPNIGRENYKTK